MFESFYGLSANPFRLSADETFRYAHKAYVRAWSYLKYALEQGEGFVLITGRPGTGKTTLIRDILAELDDSKILAVNLITNQFQSEELLRKVALNFGFDAQDYNKATLLTRISDYAVEQNAAGRHVIIIVDEAQNLTDNGLEELRLISNLQVGNQSLFQIFLIGQEELRSLIYGQGLENIQQRIVANCRVEPMDVNQTQGYIEHRLGVVGWGGQEPEFDAGIFPLIQKLTQGVPREINHIAGRLLLYGALEEKHKLTEDDLWVIVTELKKEQRMGFELEEDLEAFKKKHDIAPLVEQTDPPGTDEPDALAETAQDVQAATSQPLETGEVAAEEASQQTPTEVASPHAEEGQGKVADTGLEAGFYASEVLLKQSEDDAENNADELPPLYVDDTDAGRPPLPELEGFGRFEQAGGDKHSNLLTDVDDLLDDSQGIAGRVGKRWRWLFYPLAIAVLAGVLLQQNPGELRGLWEDTWSEIQQALSAVGAGSAPDQAREPAVEPPPAPIAEQAKVPAATDEREMAPQAATPDAPPVEPDGQADMAAQEMARSGAMQTPPETAVQPPPAAVPVPAPVPDDSTSLSGGGIVFDRNYLLTVDEKTGELGEKSRPLFFAALDALRANQQAMLIITGITVVGDNPLVRMRTALREAGIAATLFVEAGVEKERVSIESGRPEGEAAAVANASDKPPGSSPRTVRFKVVTSPGDAG